jgi:hypothetical protein
MKSIGVCAGAFLGRTMAWAQPDSSAPQSWRTFADAHLPRWKRVRPARREYSRTLAEMPGGGSCEDGLEPII